MTFEDTSHQPKHAFPDPVGFLMVLLLPFAMQLLANLLLNMLAFMEPRSKGWLFLLSSQSRFPAAAEIYSLPFPLFFFQTLINFLQAFFWVHFEISAIFESKDLKESLNFHCKMAFWQGYGFWRFGMSTMWIKKWLTSEKGQGGKIGLFY